MIDFLIAIAVLSTIFLTLYCLLHPSTTPDTPPQQDQQVSKVIVCIGSSTGFGNAFVLRCVSEGMIVFAGCRSPSGVADLIEACAGLPGRVLPFPLDVTSEESLNAFVDFVQANLHPLHPHHGIDALVNNAGVGRLGQDEWLSAEDYDAVWRVNTLGTIKATHAFYPLLKKGRGRIVFVSSICGRVALPAFGPYTVSKFATEAYADTVRRELAPFGVRVSVMEPGFFRTPLTTPGHVTGLYDSSWSCTSESTRAEYGLEFHRQQNALMTLFLNSPLNSVHINHVIDAYMHAVTDSQPRIRYVVGLDARFMWIPVSWMPSSVQDWVFRLVHGLVGFPIPAAVLNQQGSGSNASKDKVAVECEGSKKGSVGSVWEAVNVGADEKDKAAGGYCKGMDAVKSATKRG